MTFTRRIVALLISLVAVLAPALSVSAQTPHGLERAEPVGAFLDGVFPEVTPGPTGAWTLTDAFPNVTFTDPVRVVPDPSGAPIIYVVCRNGEIWKLPDDPAATRSDRVRFLDRRSVTWGFWDAGMMGLAFHPEFGRSGSPNRGYCYVFYQYTPNPGNRSLSDPSAMRLSRFTVPDGSDQVDPNSEYVMIQQFDRHNWHNGGQMFFGAEGFLYVIVGDEGAANDTHDVTQKIDDRLFSGILRIDVNRDPSRGHPIRRQPRSVPRPAGWPASFTQGYFIPADNPWQDPAGGLLEEFWTLGLRSPHSMHHDAATGNIWVAEVGQGAREEVTLARRGGNHQWPFKEGTIDGPKTRPSTLLGTENPPIHDYGRGEGGCVIGGMVYRGSEHAGSLTGKYLFGDHNTRKIWALTPVSGGAPKIEYLTSVFRSGGTKRGLAGISPSSTGECYICELGDTGTDTGKIYRLTRSGVTVPDPPARLSQTGAFTDLGSLSPRQGLLAYEINSPLWSDNALKRRWIAIPNDGSHDTAAERIAFSPEDNWVFPVGTVIVKHFELPVDERNPGITRRLETRFLVRGTDERYYGVTYRWNAEGTEAYLLSGGEREVLDIRQANGSTRRQEWIYPSRSDCLTCHTPAAGRVLGLRTHQLNREQVFPASGRTDNVLRAWNHIGLFSPAIPESAIPEFLQAAPLTDESRSLVDRVRSWLDSNCSHCHRPGGVEADFDARFTTPLSQQGLIHGTLRGSYSATEPRVVSPGDLARSILYRRANSLSDDAMPPLAKNLIDSRAMSVMADWIQQLDQEDTSPLLGHYHGGTNFETHLMTRPDDQIDFDWGGGSPSPEVPSNRFSVRWEGTLIPDFTETYRFYTATDDGVRLWINGQLMVNRWRDQSVTEVSGTLPLVAGVPASVRMEYYENGGAAVARLSWSSPRTPKAPVPASAFAGQSVPPQVTLSASATTVEGPFDVTLAFSRPVSGLAASDLEVSNGAVMALSGQNASYLARIAPDLPGDVIVRLPADAAFDARGRGNEASAELRLTHADRDPPSVNLSGPGEVVRGPFAVTAAFSESVQGFAAGAVEVSNGAVTSFEGNGASYTFTIAPLETGPVSVRIPAGAATDVAGNRNTASAPLVVEYRVEGESSRVRIFLLAGQSNMSGEGDRQALPPDLLAPQGDVDFYYRVPGGEDVFTLLQPGSSDGRDFGPELTLGRALADHYALAEPGTRVALIKFARGGSRLYADWGSGQGEWTTFNEVVSGGLAALSARYPGAALDISAFFWQQGEADALSGQADLYAVNLTALIGEVRALYGADLPFVYGRLSLDQLPAVGLDGGRILRQAQESVDGLDAFVRMIDTDGMNVQLADPIHFDESGLLDLGEGLAEGFLDVQGVILPDTEVTLTTNSAEVSGPFEIEVTSSRPLTGLEASDFVITHGAAEQLAGSSRNFVLTVTPLDAGEIGIQLPAGMATDPLGGAPLASNVLTVRHVTGTLVDALDDITLPSEVRRGGEAVVSIRYRAAGPRDMQILLHDALEGWRVDASHFTPVDPGAGRLDLTLPVAPAARVGGNYLWAVRLIPSGRPYTEAVAEVYREATMLEAENGSLFDEIRRFTAPREVERGQTVTVEMEYQATETLDVQLLLQDSRDGWRTVSSALGQVSAGSGTRLFQMTVDASARTGDGYVWVNRLLPPGSDHTEAVAEAYEAAAVLLPSGGGAAQDLIHRLGAPTAVRRARTATVEVDYEATEPRDLNLVLLDSLDGWQVVGQARSEVPAGSGTKVFTVGMAGDARVGEGYVWVAQLLPSGATDATEAYDQKYVAATMEDSPESEVLVNHAVLPGATASQSSVYGQVYGADLARDGNTDGDWRNGSVTHTQLDAGAWWEIDLGASRFIDHVFVWNRTDCCGDRLRDFYVLVSDEPMISDSLDEVLAQPGVEAAYFESSPQPTARLEVGGSGRHVRVQLAGEGYLSLAEVEIFGSLESSRVNGLTYQYHEGVFDALPDSFDSLPARSTGTVSGVSLEPRLRDDYFAMRFRGCLEIPVTGAYTFHTESDAGSRFFINGLLVAEDGVDPSDPEPSGTVSLGAGMHPIEIHYFETDGGQSLALSWEGPGLARQTIPSASFFVNETGVSPSFRYRLPQRLASDNADGDLLDLAAEYALGTNPYAGDMRNAGVIVDLEGDEVGVFYERPRGLTEYRYVLEASGDLVTWTDLSGAEIIPLEGGREQVRYRRIGQRTPLSPDRGFVRLRLEHRGWNHVSHTPVVGWQASRLTEGYQTFGTPFAPAPIFGGRVADVRGGSRLVTSAGGLSGLLAQSPASRHHLEITSGPLEGHRVAIQEPVISDQELAVNWQAPENTLDSEAAESLAGETFVIYRYPRLSEAFPPDAFASGRAPDEADRILFYEGGQYAGFYLLAGPGDDGTWWTAVGDSELGDWGDRLLLPGEGCFIQRPVGRGETLLTMSGHVRAHARVDLPVEGYRLLGPPAPVWSSLERAGLGEDSGTVAAADPADADQVLVWDPESASFRGLFFFAAPGQRPYWTPIEGTELDNHDDLLWLAPDRGFFLRRASGDGSVYRMPSPLDFAQP